MKLVPLFFLIIGLTSITFFYYDIYFSITISVALTTFILFFFVYQLTKNRTGILICLLLGIYLLPFIHIIPFIWFNFDSYPKPEQLWWWDGYPVIYTLGYMIDEQTIKLTAMLGLTGATGIAFGAFTNRNKLNYDTGFNLDGSKRFVKTMSLSFWFLWLLIGLILGLLAASKGSVFEASYLDSKSFIDNVNFSSAGMMYMIILTYTFADALLDNNASRRKIKLLLSFALISYVIIWLELLRGEREAMAWIFGLLLAYVYWASSYLSGRKIQIKIPWLKLTFSIILILFITMILGYARTQLAGTDLSQAINVIKQGNVDGTVTIYKMMRGTWTGVMLTPLSVAGDYVNGILDLKWGLDYLNVLLSLPPGFVADFFLYERPLTRLQGPAYDLSFGMGGVHQIVVPFKNFRILGVFLIPAIWSYIFSRYERNCVRKLSTINLSLLITVVMVSPEWLWYGDKYSINALIIWFILSLFYKISLGSTYKSKNY